MTWAARAGTSCRSRTAPSGFAWTRSCTCASTPPSTASASADPSGVVTARLAALDLALYRLARTAGHTPGAERAVRRVSLLGEHAAVWLALGGLGMALDPKRRKRWGRG